MRLKLPFELTAKKDITFRTQSQVYGDSLWLSRKKVYNEIKVRSFLNNEGIGIRTWPFMFRKKFFQYFRL